MKPRTLYTLIVAKSLLIYAVCYALHTYCGMA
jgi:hypothetical protein